MTTRAPLGTWTSPITAAVLRSSGLTLSEVVADGDDLYGLEGRPAESGRSCSCVYATARSPM